MKTENEIKAMTLEQRQKLVIDLRGTPVGDKYYPTAKALIDFTVKTRGWKEPETVEVKNIAGFKVTVDGAAVEKEGAIKVFPWQLAALARFLEPVGKAAAMLLLCLGVLSAVNARATTTPAFGSAGSYNGVFIAGLNGGTNSVPTNTVTTYTAATYVTNTIVSPAVVQSNGLTYFSLTTNITSIVTNVPGVFPIPANVPFTLSYQSALFGAAGQSVAKFSYSPNGGVWQSNYWSLPLTAIGSTEVTGTNLQVAAMSGGWGRLDSLSGLVTSGGTNLSVLITSPK